MKEKIPVSLEELIDKTDILPEGCTVILNKETGGFVFLSDLSDSWDEDGNCISMEDNERFYADDKYIVMPHNSAREDYENMEAFAATIKDSSFRRALESALSQKHPFRRFRDTLRGNAVYQERWNKFEAECHRKMIMEWLEENNLEPAGK